MPISPPPPWTPHQISGGVFWCPDPAAPGPPLLPALLLFAWHLLTAAALIIMAFTVIRANAGPWLERAMRPVLWNTTNGRQPQ